MDPYNYSLGLPQQSPSAGLRDSFGNVQSVLALKAAGQEMQKEQAALEQQKMMRTDLSALAQKQNPTAADYASLATKYPTLADNLKGTFNAMDEDRRKTSIEQMSQVYSALHAGQSKIAQGILTEQAVALRNSGRESDAKHTETLSKLIELSPTTALTSTGIALSSFMGPDKFTETFEKLESNRRNQELQASTMTKSQSEANKAAIEAKFAESNAVLDLQKKGWDISKIQNDIDVSRQNIKIAALNAKYNKEENELKRDEMKFKLDQVKAERDQKLREKSAELETARASIDNMLNTGERVLKTPMGVVGSAAGPISSRVITLTQGTADFEGLLETMSSQAFMAQIPNLKGMGALSNAEGEKLQASLQNLSLKQSPERVVENVREAMRLITKSRKNLADRYGVPESIPDTPAAGSDPNEIDALVEKYTSGS